MTYWVLVISSPDVSGNIFWCGYTTKSKDHTWSRDSKNAIRFCRREDAEKAGVRIATGELVACEQYCGEHDGR